MVSIGYEAPLALAAPMRETAAELVTGLRALRRERQRRPIIFLAHSYGVPLLKAVRSFLSSIEWVGGSVGGGRTVTDEGVGKKFRY